MSAPHFDNFKPDAKFAAGARVLERINGALAQVEDSSAVGEGNNAMTGQILLAGGTGAIGRLTARSLRAAHPDLPPLVGGRDLGRAEEAGAEIGTAQAVVLDPTADDFGLGENAVSDGDPPTPAGLYFPCQLLGPTADLARLEQDGGTVLNLEVL